MLGKPKRIINMVIEDYVIRVIENAGQVISAIRLLKEKALPLGLIENGKITDEIGFFEFLRDLVKELGIKNRYVRFYVPNSLVIMREVEFPANLKEKDIKEHFQYEIGKSIHLPFKEPVFDVHYLSTAAEISDENNFEKQSEVRTGTLFAAPEEDMVKYTDVLVDAGLKPIVADVEALGIYRFIDFLYELSPEKVYMVVQLNVTALNLSIFYDEQLEFMRYQKLDVELKGWHVDNEIEEINWEYVEDETQQMGIVEDQLLELERIMNFYRFSIKKGDQMVNEILILGDHPLVKQFYEKVNQQLDIPVKLLRGYTTKEKDKEVRSEFIPALGLALKGGAKDAS
ncbi:type IV pilus biogenesis protein PilM [Oceanobacillus bengalensis]|uniref:Pilus assembly protein PilM n=1 Tax=Oceanobacillus bengalensis TaxID=1435466 RepID=A0A494YWX5_9BACI|nr:pilus assembly protein PilM [Oceanobacillus bengalensis]RKQ14654.1 hypothetical protein D8M05_12500 [Oceanobacillus bengalensis]